MLIVVYQFPPTDTASLCMVLNTQTDDEFSSSHLLMDSSSSDTSPDVKILTCVLPRAASMIKPLKDADSCVWRRRRTKNGNSK